MVAESRRFDISGIDFELLRREFAKSKEKNLVLKDIQELLQERIAQMLAQNPSRINFYEKYQEIIHDYNQEQNRATIEKTFEELMKLSHDLTEEEKRYIREGFENDEQLSMYDVLMKDDLSKEDIKKLKVVAKELLEKIKAQLATMDHPFDKQETRASIIITIRASSSPFVTSSGRNSPRAIPTKASTTIAMLYITTSASIMVVWHKSF